MPNPWSQTHPYERETEPASASPTASVSTPFAGMPFRARALRDTANAAFGAASARLSKADGSQIGGTLRGLWSALAGHEEHGLPVERSVLLQPGWAVKRFVPRSDRGFASLPALPELVDHVDKQEYGSEATSANDAASARMSLKQPTSISRAHHNLDARLQPFWSSLIPNHPVRIRISISSSLERKRASTSTEDVILNTDAQGYFQQQIEISPDRVKAALLSEVDRTVSADIPGQLTADLCLTVTAEVEQSAPGEVTGVPSGHPAVRTGPGTAHRLACSNDVIDAADARNIADNTAIMRVSNPGGVRVLSDIDDTIKHSDILGGVREVFRNVFCRDTEEMAVAGMSSLFSDIASAGARGFHYVSNSPIELAASIIEFLHFHSFPAHFSLTLKAYGGRSLITSLFEQPMERKRQSALRLFDAFPEAKFVLFGDSGEQDLELYLSISQLRPDQVLGIFIRDITSRRAADIRSLSIARRPTMPSSRSSESLARLDAPPDNSSGRVYDEPESYDADHDSGARPEVDFNIAEELTSAQQKLLRRATMWDERVATTRASLPSHIPLLLFAEPDEIASYAVNLVRQYGVRT